MWAVGTDLAGNSRRAKPVRIRLREMTGLPTGNRADFARLPQNVRSPKSRPRGWEGSHHMDWGMECLLPGFFGRAVRLGHSYCCSRPRAARPTSATPALSGVGRRGVVSDGSSRLGSPSGSPGAARSRRRAAGADDGTSNHLPPEQRNIELVGKLELDTPAQLHSSTPTRRSPDPSQPEVMPGQIADLAVYKDFAYLNLVVGASAGAAARSSSTSTTPQRSAGLRSCPRCVEHATRRGRHVVTLNTPAGPGDVLAVNNEPCRVDGSSAASTSRTSRTRPTGDVRAGRRRPIPVPPRGSCLGETKPVRPRSHHSTTRCSCGRERRRRALRRRVGHTELHDLDIFEDHGPGRPQPVAESTSSALPDRRASTSYRRQRALQRDLHARHGREEDRRLHPLLLNYWDAGYVTVDVDEPRRPA